MLQPAISAALGAAHRDDMLRAASGRTTTVVRARTRRHSPRLGGRVREWLDGQLRRRPGTCAPAVHA